MATTLAGDSGLEELTWDGMAKKESGGSRAAGDKKTSPTAERKWRK
jgi:hypothetical protein